MHSRKRSAAFLSDDTTTVDAFLAPNGSADGAPHANTSAIEQNGPSKRLQHNTGAPLAITHPRPRYNAQRLLNSLAFTRLYVTAKYQQWDPAASPVVLCCAGEQNELYASLCQMLPALYTVCPTLQALAVTAGYVTPNAVADQSLLRVLPLVTTAGLEGTVASELESFMHDLGPGDCIAVLAASGTCLWTSREASSLQDLQNGIVNALSSGPDKTNGDAMMPDG